MASVWKHPKSVNWVARYRGTAGKTVNRSTGTSGKGEAERIAQTWEIEAARERERGKGEVSSAGISDTVARAERLARQGRLDAASARELINGLLAAAGQQALDAITNRTWCEGWKAGKAGAVKERSQWKYDQVCRDWLTFLNGKGDKPLEMVGRTEAIAFRDSLRSAGLAPRTINQTMKLLRGIYTDAVEQGHIGRNPFAGVDSLRDAADDVAREPFTVSEVARLIESADDEWKGLIILAATTGLRLMDAARLQWRSIDAKTGVIKVKTAKTGAVLTLPVHPDFAAWLQTQQRGIGATPIFPELATKSGAGKSGLSSMFKRLMGRAGVAAGVGRAVGVKTRGRATSRKSFHSLRHFAATQLAAAGVRSEIARQITGHADAQTHANYITADNDTLRSAVGQIRLAV